MVLESVEVDSVAPYHGRPYEWLAGRATFAVDPALPGNDRITDLDLAPRGTDGKVRFEADVRCLRPTEGTTDRVLVVVPNRGMIGGLPLSVDAGFPVAPTDIPDAGDGFLLDRGWAIAWCGWQWDVEREAGWLGLAAPPVDVEPGRMRLEFRPDVVERERSLSDSSVLFQFRAYSTADVDDPNAVLTVRTAPLGPRQVVPRDSWRFVDDAHVTVDGGFQPFHWYELVYRAAIAPVVGCGLLAVRDFGAHLRDTYPLVFAFGSSQSGRFLRELLHEGLNVDETGRTVFDAVFAHIAGARRGEFNLRYGQPGLTHPLTPGYGPPYDTAALLDRQRRLGGVPKVVFTNTSWEYWRGDGALVHQDPRTGADLPEDTDARVHLEAGIDHIGPFPIKDVMPVANPVHHLDGTPLLRALFVQLEEWACDGIEPEPSRVPRRADGTLVTRPEALRSFREGVLPDPACLPWTPAIDPTSTSWPLELGEPMVALVSAVGADGNELAGIRLPEVVVPVAAYTGWNPRVHVDDLPDVLYEFVGSRLPLQSQTAVADRATYEESVRAAARSLVAQRFLLDVDVERTVSAAMQWYDDRDGDAAASGAIAE